MAVRLMDEPAGGNPLLADSEHAGCPLETVVGEHIATGIDGGP
jgi:hypothetical protein